MITIILACLLICLLFSPLGCTLLWQKKSYFADGLAHACLLATSLSLCYAIPIIISAPLTAVIFALLVFVTQSKLDGDTSINIVSNTMLALGLLIANIAPNSINLNILLLGDILSVNHNDIAILAALVFLTAIIFALKLNDIVLLSLNTDLAKVHGIDTKKTELILLILLALVLAFSMKITGILLVSAMLIIPASTALLLSNTPIQMICCSICIALIACTSGLCISFYYDLSTTASIIASSALIHFSTIAYKKMQ